jgi:hypothetical protein
MSGVSYLCLKREMCARGRRHSMQSRFIDMTTRLLPCPFKSHQGGLKASGRRLWDAVAGEFILTPAELANLAEACRTSDELDRLERAVRALPELTTTGSTGQLKPHPLLGEVRAHRQLLQRLVDSLNLPDADQEIGPQGKRPTRQQSSTRPMGQVEGDRRWR